MLGEGVVLYERARVGGLEEEKGDAGLEKLRGARESLGGSVRESMRGEGVVLGRNVVVETGAVVEASEVGEGSVVEAGAVVGRGAVLGRVRFHSSSMSGYSCAFVGVVEDSLTNMVVVLHHLSGFRCAAVHNPARLHGCV